MEFIMRRIALVFAFMIALVAPAVAQKAKIEAVNAKWTELFNKGDFEGVAQLYTVDAIAFPWPIPAVMAGSHSTIARVRLGAISASHDGFSVKR
jgi:ketosteroid isomerase-like protein